LSIFCTFVVDQINDGDDDDDDDDVIDDVQMLAIRN